MQEGFQSYKWCYEYKQLYSAHQIGKLLSSSGNLAWHLLTHLGHA